MAEAEATQPSTAPNELESQPVGDISPPKATIVLIHGLWMSSVSWEDWGIYYTNIGYEVLAPGWPGLEDRSVSDIRANPKALEGLTIGAIVDHYSKIIQALPQPPIIIGHSFGGLFAQILLSRGLGLAGVGICPAQPSGVITLKPSTVKASFSILGNPLTYNKAVPITESQFHYAFGNALSAAHSKKVWETYAIPAAAHVLWQGALGLVIPGDGRVNWGKKDRAPLLLVAGTKDRIIPAVVVKKEWKKYSGPAVVELKVFEGRTHGIVLQEGWEEVAKFTIEWVEEKVKFDK